jgi:hypothetical protein
MRLVALVIVAMLAFGCSNYYWIGDEAFRSKEKALQRADELNSDCLDSITPTKTPVGGSALVVLPSAARIERTGIKIGGSVSEDIVDFEATAYVKNVQSMADAIKKRSIFDKTDIVSSDAPETSDFNGHNYLVYLYLESPDVFQWYMKSRTAPEPQPLPLDTGKSVGSARTIAWLNTVEQTASKEAAK